MPFWTSSVCLMFHAFYVFSSVGCTGNPAQVGLRISTNAKNGNFPSFLLMEIPYEFRGLVKDKLA